MIEDGEGNALVDLDDVKEGLELFVKLGETTSTGK